MNVRQVVPDWIKGLAILLMVYGHINHVGSLVVLQKQVVDVIYTFHMPLFLMISGFFFKFSDRKGAGSVNKLISRLFLPYSIFISLYLVGLVLIQKIGVPTSNLPPVSFFDFVRILLFNPRGAYWFIHTIIVIQLCFIFSGVAASRMNLSDSVFVCVSVFLLAMACACDLIVPRSALYFCIGMVLGCYEEKLPMSIKIGAPMMGLILLFSREGIFIFSIAEVAWCLSVLTFVAGVGRAAESSSIVSIFAWLGRNSLVVLVLHAMFIVMFKPVSSFALRFDHTGLAYSAIVVAATMLGSMLVAFLFDKARVSKYFFGVDAIYSDLVKPDSPTVIK